MPDIESLLKEKRVFEPSEAFRRRAKWSRATVAEYRELGAKSPERFWARRAREHVSWFSPWKKTLVWKRPFAKWFVGAKLNVAYNCLDRHLEGENAWRRNKAAIIWEGEPGDQRVLTYGQLHREVCKFANVLKEAVDKALEGVRSVRHVVVVERTREPVRMMPDRDHWWHELMANASPK